MFTQETQSSASGASKTEPWRSRKPVAIIATALVILAAIGVYFVGFRSLPTTVSWAPSVSAIAAGDDLTIAGQITPANPDRQVLVQSAPTAKGPWQQVLPTITTDNQARFAATFKPPLTGSIVMRVVVGAAGRHDQVIGLSRPVRLLTLSSLSLKGIGTPTNRNRVSFATTVNPPSPGRTVRIEQSRDKRHWAPVGLTVKTKADGISVIKVSGLAIGQWSYRATVDQDDNFAAALSPVVGAKVEDYKLVEARVAAEKARAQAAADAEEAKARAAAHAEAAKKTASTDPNKPNCPVNQGPISGNWCLHSANGPDNPGYVQQCEVPGVPKYQWPAAVDGKCD